MPIELKPKTSVKEEAPKAKGLTLFNEDGELTLPGDTIADFLESADFSAVTESPDALPFLSNPAACDDDPYVGTLAEEHGVKVGDRLRYTDGKETLEGTVTGFRTDLSSAVWAEIETAEGLKGGIRVDVEGFEKLSEAGDADADKEKEGSDADKGDDADKEKEGDDADDDADSGDDEEGDSKDEPVAECALPGAVAARLVDEDDLTEMFGYYLDQLAAVEDPSLQEQAVLAVFADYHDDEHGGILEDQREEVAEMLRAVLTEGVVYDAAEEIDERIMTKGARRHATKIRKRPKSGKRRQQLKKRRREEGRGAKKQKIGRQHKMRTRRKASRIKQLARESADGTLIFGLGDGINGANLRIGLSENPNLEFTNEELIAFDVMAGSVFDCPNEDCDSSHPFTVFLVEAMHKHKKGKKKKKDKGGDYDDHDESDLEEMAKVKFSSLSSGTKFSFAHLRGGGVKEDGDHYKSGGKSQKVGDSNILVVVKEDYDGMCPDCGETIESMLDEKGKVPEAFKKHMKKKKGDNGDDDDDDDENGGKKKKGNPFGKKKDEDETLAPSQVPGPFAIAAGRPNLSEGHSLAASTLALMAPPRTLTEGED